MHLCILDRHWTEQASLGPLQRWMAALREVVLKSLPAQSEAP